MKKYLMLFISIIILILSVVKSWYSNQLIDLLFVFYFIPNLILFLLFNFCLVNSIKKIKEKFYINYINLIILLISVLLFIFFPFREFKVKYELDKFEDERLKIIEKITNYELKIDEIGNVKLPKEYKRYSTSGEVFAYQNNEEGQVIGFWILRGIQSGSVELIYSTGGEDLIRKNETGHPITKIEKLKENWFYVETDY